MLHIKLGKNLQENMKGKVLKCIVYEYFKLPSPRENVQLVNFKNKNQRYSTKL